MVQDGSGSDWADQERIVNIVNGANFHRRVCTVINHSTILLCSDNYIARIVLCLCPLGMREQACPLLIHIFSESREQGNKFHCNSKQANRSFRPSHAVNAFYERMRVSSKNAPYRPSTVARSHRPSPHARRRIRQEAENNLCSEAYFCRSSL